MPHWVLEIMYVSLPIGTTPDAAAQPETKTIISKIANLLVIPRLPVLTAFSLVIFGAEFIGYGDGIRVSAG
jgi:hypothetical protein